MYKRLWDLIGSRNLSIFIFVMGMVYFLILLIFSMVIPLPGVENISKLLPYKVLYILFFLNLLVCEIKWLPVVIRKCRKPAVPETEEALRRFGHRREVRSLREGDRPHATTSLRSVSKSGTVPEAERLTKYLRRRGYRVQIAEKENDSSHNTKPQTVLYASRGRFSPLGNLFLHLSFLFLLLGVGISVLYRFDGTIILAEGQGTSEEGVRYVSSYKSKLASAPTPLFEVSNIVPTFWMNQLLFTDLKAEVTLNGEKGIVRLSQPIDINGAKVSITGMGITPEYLLRDREGKELDNGYVALNIFTPGSEDWFVIPGTSFRIFASFYPDFEQKGKMLTTRSMNPVNPAFRIKIFRNERNLYNGIVKLGEEVRFANVRLTFPDFKYSGIFRVLQDRGFVFIWTGLIIMITGLIWRLLFYRKEIIVWEDNYGERYIAALSDYYQELFSAEVERMAEMV